MSIIIYYAQKMTTIMKLTMDWQYILSVYPSGSSRLLAADDKSVVTSNVTLRDGRRSPGRHTIQITLFYGARLL